MATPAEVSTMASDARCFECVSEKQLMAFQVYLLWSALHPGETMTTAAVQTLANDSACLAACASHKQLLAMNVQLLFEAATT